MSITCGKKARKNGGTRYDVKRRGRAAKVEKVFRDNKLSPEQYRAMKLSDRKAMNRKG